MVIVLVAALAGVLPPIGYRGIYLLGQDRWTLRLLGVATLVLPLVGVWVVAAELRFGMASQRLAERLAAEGSSAEPPEIPRLPSGRPDRVRGRRAVRRAAGGGGRRRRTTGAAGSGWPRSMTWPVTGAGQREALRTAIEKAQA